MGVELMSNDMAINEMDDAYLSDTEVFYSVIQVLDGVRMVRGLEKPESCEIDHQ